MKQRLFYDLSLFFFIISLGILIFRPAPDHLSETIEKEFRVMAILPVEHNVFWENIWASIRDEAENSSFMLSEYEFSDIKDAGWILDLAEETKPDGILLCPKGTLSDSIFEQLARLKQQGCKIVLLDTQIPAAYYDVFVGIDNQAAGAAAAQYVCQQHTKQQPIIQVHNVFPPYPSTTQERIRGFHSVMEQNHLTPLLHDLITTSDASPGIPDIKNALQSYELPLFLIGFSPGFTLKAAFTVAASGLSDQIHVIGFAESPEALQYVQDGVIQALFIQDTRQLGQKSAEIMQQLLSGASVFAEYYIDVTLVTSENVSNYINLTP